MNESNIGNLLLTDQLQENDDPETWSCRFGGSLMGVSSWACYYWSHKVACFAIFIVQYGSTVQEFEGGAVERAQGFFSPCCIK